MVAGAEFFRGAVTQPTAATPATAAKAAPVKAPEPEAPVSEANSIWGKAQEGVKCAACWVLNPLTAKKCVSCNAELGGAAGDSKPAPQAAKAPAPAASTAKAPGSIGSGGFTFGAATTASAPAAKTEAAPLNFGAKTAVADAPAAKSAFAFNLASKAAPVRRVLIHVF